MNKFFHALRVYIVLSLILGLAYPFVITFIAQVTMPEQANGSLLIKGTTVIGSTLIAQNFTKPEYFFSRQSANGYDGTNSGGTNFGPSSQKLMDSVRERIKQVRQEDEISSDTPIPADMVLSSASGLDPHISFENALLQARRVARVRGVDINIVRKIIDENTEPDFIGMWGRPAVNVLKLNYALDMRQDENK
ncbi:MAG: potassium-transporting ATPase subunit KdpC [Endomicrobiales bacterium]|jgi:K+-transporting ATPase ATPase C chain